MDGSRFDHLTRTITISASRRLTLGGLAAGLLAACGLALDELTALAKKKKKGKGKGKKKDKNKKCPDGRARCGGKCCGAKETCRNGRCVHHCEDGEKNFGETGKDCGRVCDGVLGNVPISRCDLREPCEEDRDCKLDQFCREPRPGAGKQCVECLIDTHCGGGRCLDNFCFGCAINADCPRPNDPPEFEFCIAINGICPNNQPCVCRECRQDGDCPAARPHCQLGTGTAADGECFECLEDTDCPEGQLCDEDGRCESFDECGADQDFCADGRAGCNGNDECACLQTVTNQPICASNALAGLGCISSADCAPLGPGAACVRIHGRCGQTNTACARPCN